MNFVSKTLTWDLPTTINYSSDKIELSIGNKKASLTFAELAARPDWLDFSLFAVRLNPVVDPADLIASGVVNVLAHTAVGRRTTYELSRDLNSSLLVHVFVPYRDAKSFDDCEVQFITTDSVTSNVPLTDITSDNAVWRKQRTGIVMTGPVNIDADSVATIDFQLVDKGGKPVAKSVNLELSASAGYLNKRRLTLDANGSGSVKVRADLLASGDEITIKASYKYFSGISSIKLEVK